MPRCQLRRVNIKQMQSIVTDTAMRRKHVWFVLYAMKGLRQLRTTATFAWLAHSRTHRLFNAMLLGNDERRESFAQVILGVILVPFNSVYTAEYVKVRSTEIRGIQIK